MHLNKCTRLAQWIKAAVVADNPPGHGGVSVVDEGERWQTRLREHA